MSDVIEGKRVFNWRSQSCRWPKGTCRWPSGATEEIEFGLVDPKSHKWLVRVTVLWIVQDGQMNAIVHDPLADWSRSIQFKDIAGKLAGLTKSPVELPAFRVAIALSSAGYEDVTEYVPTHSENEIRRELREAEECVEYLKDRLAGGYYER